MAGAGYQMELLAGRLDVVDVGLREFGRRQIRLSLDDVNRNSRCKRSQATDADEQRPDYSLTTPRASLPTIVAFSSLLSLDAFVKDSRRRYIVELLVHASGELSILSANCLMYQPHRVSCV